MIANTPKYNTSTTIYTKTCSRHLLMHNCRKVQSDKISNINIKHRYVKYGKSPMRGAR